MQKWPEIDDGKLFSYILKVKAVDVEYIGKYKDQKAYSYWMSGFVDTVYVAKCLLHSRSTYLKGNVSSSQKLNEDSHRVWVCVEGKGKDCRIVTSWCTCTAGTAEACNHVIPIFYKINYAFNKDFVSLAAPVYHKVGTRALGEKLLPHNLRSSVSEKTRKPRKQLSETPSWNKQCRKGLTQESLKIGS